MDPFYFKFIGTFWASIMTIIMFCQINATLFDRDVSITIL